MAKRLAKAKQLSQKQNNFVDAFMVSGVAAQAAKEAYDIAPTDHHLAAVIGSENLTKPDIQAEIARRITPEMVEDAHESLLTAVRLDYFVFSKSMTDEEIVSHVAAQGLDVLNIRVSDRGKLAFFSLPDGASRGKGIELYHKVHGTFAPDKHITVNVDVAPNERIKRLADKLNGK